MKYRYVFICLFNSSCITLLNSIAVIFSSFRRLYLLLLLSPWPVSTMALKKTIHDLLCIYYIFVDWGCFTVIGEH